MAEYTKEQLIELITKEIVRLTGAGPECPPAGPVNGPVLAVIGSCEAVPDCFRREFRLEQITEGLCPDGLEQYEKVLITSLSLTELSDIALGRNARPTACTVTSALLSGKDVILLASALPHRQYKQTAKQGFYEMLEQSVKTLQAFGVTLYEEGGPVERYLSAKSEELPKAVITETLARKLVKDCAAEEIMVRKGTVVTPSAKDIFLHSGKTLKLI